MSYRPDAATDDGFARRTALFYAAYFVFAGLHLPFLPVWLEARGLDAAEIGIVLAAGMAARPLVVPVATRLADRRGWLKGPLVAATWATAASMLLLQASHGFVPILAANALASLAFALILPFADAFALRGLTARGRAYGPVRLWGSVTFIVANVGGGLLLERLGAGNIVWALTAAMLATALAASLLRPLGGTSAVAAPATAGASLWGSRTFVAVVAIGSVVQSSHAVLYGFASLQWAARGLDGLQIGALWGIGVVAEIGLFAVSGRLAGRLRPIDMLALGAGGALLRWGVMAFDPPTALLPALQCLHALSFGATHLGAMQFLAAERRGATAQGDYASVVAVVFTAAMGAAGLLVEAFGSLAYLAMAASAMVGTVIAVAARR
ncbi:MFS transporter [Rhodoplanes serenus]|uniref:MFS transporter n=1 Tax=Rhodoplanes serenus TaxID=200615 RepID=A0A9X4XMP7_9BRAD|nr:MFS transporter [Rhodoplanes serenus]MTW15326.1 MFS transporter [Rhodoplanes serenus]